MTTGAWAAYPHVSTTAVRVRVQGDFPAESAQYARELVAAALRDSPEPVSDVRVRLSEHRDPAVHFPVVAQANLDLADVPVRAQVRGATAREAVEALQARLRHQLERATRPARADQRGHWRHPRPRTPRAATYPRPATACRVVRYKPCRLALLGVDQAVHQMECRDSDFHLFVEVGTGQDSVVYRCGANGYRLAQVLPDQDRLAPHTVAVTCYDRPAARLETAHAVELFGMTEVPFLFFVALDPDGSADPGGSDACDAEVHPDARGRVLYRRFDGHYGLIFSSPQIPGPRMPATSERAGGAGDPAGGDLR